MTHTKSTLRSRGRVLALAASALLVLTLAGGISAASADPASTYAPSSSSATRRPDTVGPTKSTVHYAISEPVCARPANPDLPRCFAMKRVAVSKGTRNAHRYVVPDALTTGPAGGYTPADLATAYHYDPTVRRSNQLVGIIDWYDDPYALADLNTFDRTYHLPTETHTSFRKVNQRGRTSPLPKADKGSSGEIALDVESVRAVCHTCRILLIEADAGTDADLAIAENRAAAMGATEISNSFGEPERAVKPSVRAAYNHPGVVITASTGDDGWYAWDHANDSGGRSSDVAEYPSTDPNVIAVGGTTLAPTGGGFEEDVWNENGADDQTGAGSGHQGAGGGGCSTRYAAAAWQAHYRGYSAAGCHGKRLAADVSAIADAQYGFDILDSYSGGWGTYGGTSLAAPVVAALYALAGGSGGSSYPAASLYVNGSVRAAGFHDVVAGGNGFCAGDSTSTCGFDVYTYYSGNRTYNPNALGAGNLECSFPRNTTSPATPPPLSSECNATQGFDGPSGIGSPRSDSIFLPTTPTVAIAHSRATRSRTTTLTARLHERVTSTHGVTYRWSFGDGRSAITRTASVHHVYHRTGRVSVRLVEIDNRYQQVRSITSITITK